MQDLTTRRNSSNDVAAGGLTAKVAPAAFKKTESVHPLAATAQPQPPNLAATVQRGAGISHQGSVRLPKTRHEPAQPEQHGKGHDRRQKRQAKTDPSGKYGTMGGYGALALDGLYAGCGTA